jgi:hypothetical protein
VISLIAFASACLVTRTRNWIVQNSMRGKVTFLLTGIVITVVFEIPATGPLARRAYAEAMPVLPILGASLAPVLQWVILPIIEL